MANYNYYFANDFRSCTLLAYARDPYRERDVRIYQIPGEVENVGITDGTDKWIAPVIANPFSVNIIALMDNIRNGIPNPKPEPPGSTRRRLTIDTQQKQAGIPRHALLEPLNQPQPTVRKRHVLLAGI